MDKSLPDGPRLAHSFGMKNLFGALIVLGLLVLPGSARALETDELIALTAMPLVVAAAAELTDVPMHELMSVVSTLNHAAVPPTQFVEIVRYAPVAVVAPTEPRFTTLLTTEYARGVSGSDLSYAIAEQYPAYGVEEIQVVDPPVVTYVERQEYLPEVVVTRFEPQPVDPLALVAMPLAVAAVAEITDVPRNDLVSFVSALNRAMMPAPQFVEVVRYSPAVLVDRVHAPVFLSFVTREVDRGIVGRPLAFSLAERMDVIGIDGIDIIDPPTTVIVERNELLPPLVTTRLARSHPHGGPPGQLKKELGLQTGAEVVHGTSRGRGRSGRSTSVARVDRDDDDRPRPKRKVSSSSGSNRGGGKREARVTSRGRGGNDAPVSRRVVRSSGGDDRPRGNSGKVRTSGSSGSSSNVSKGRGGGRGNNSGGSGASKGNSGQGKGKGKG